MTFCQNYPLTVTILWFLMCEPASWCVHERVGERTNEKTCAIVCTKDKAKSSVVFSSYRIIDSEFVSEEVGRCRSEYVDTCTTFTADVWLQALPAVIDGLKAECSQGEKMTASLHRRRPLAPSGSTVL